MCFCGSPRWRRGDYGISRQTPQRPRFRVIRIAVVPMIFLFVLARHGLVLINGWALFDLLPGEINEKHLSIGIKMAKRMRRNQHLAPAQPSAGIGNKIANGPSFIVEVKISDLTDLAVGGPQFFSVTLLNAV